MIDFDQLDVVEAWIRMGGGVHARPALGYCQLRVDGEWHLRMIDGPPMYIVVHTVHLWNWQWWYGGGGGGRQALSEKTLAELRKVGTPNWAAHATRQAREKTTRAASLSVLRSAIDHNYLTRAQWDHDHRNP